MVADSANQDGPSYSRRRGNRQRDSKGKKEGPVGVQSLYTLPTPVLLVSLYPNGFLFWLA